MYSFAMQCAKRGRQPVYVLMGIVIAAMLTIGAFFSEGIAFFNPVYTSFMTNSEYFLSLGAVLLIVLIFLFLAHRYFHIKQNYIFLSFALILFFGNLIALMMFPSVYQTQGVKYAGDKQIFDAFNIVYFLNDMDRVRYIITFGVTCLYLYLMFVYFPQVLKNSRALNIYFIAAIVVIFVSVIWSVYFEWDIYKAFFNPEEGKSMEVIQSFWGNRNTFGTMVLIGIIGCGYLQCRSRHFWYYILMVLFMITQIFILSKTAIFLGLLFIAAFLIYRYIATVKRHWLKDNIALVVVLGIIGASVWLIASGTIHDIPYVGRAYEHVCKELFGNDFASFHSRVFIWKVVMRDLFTNPLFVALGFGDGNYLRLLGYELEGNMLKFGYTHNGFLAMFAYGGILRLAIYLAMLVYVFVLMIINFTKKKHPHNVACMIGFFIIIGHSLVETTAFMGSDAKSTAVMLLIYLPVLIDRYNDRHQEKNVGVREFSLSMKEEDAESRKETSRGHLFTPVFFSSVFAATILLMFSLAKNVVGVTELIYTAATFVISVVVSICFAYRTLMKKPWAVGIWRIVCSLVIVMMYLSPIIFKPLALQIYAGLAVSLVLLLTLLGPEKSAHNVKLRVIKPLLIGFGVIASGYLIGRRFSVMTVEMTRYTVLVLVLIYDLLLLLVFLALPSFTNPQASPLARMFVGWSRYERAATLHGDKVEEKLANKIAKYKEKRERKRRAVA